MVAIAALLLASGCTKALITRDDAGSGSGSGGSGGSDAGSGAGSGGSGAGGAARGSGGSTVTGSGGAVAGTGGAASGSGGVSAATGGRSGTGGSGGAAAGSGGGAGGGAPGTGGAAAGPGGTAAGSGGRGGGAAPGTGGGAPGSGGVSGLGGAAAGIAGNGGGADPGTGGAGGALVVGVRPSAAGQIVVTELMHDVDVVADDFGEWFEVYNPSDTVTYNLRACSIRDINDNMVTITTSLLVPPHAFRTLANWTADMQGFTPDYVYTTLKFDNDASDSVSVVCDGLVIDRFLYSATLAATSGHSFSVDPMHYDATDNDATRNVCLGVDVYHQVGGVADFGTPGRTNPPCP